MDFISTAGELDGVVTAITTNAAAFTPAAVTVIGIGAGITLLLWGAPKLLGVLKRTAK